MRIVIGFIALLWVTAPSLAATQVQGETRAQKNPSDSAAKAQSKATADRDEEPGNLTLPRETEIEVELKTAIDLKNIKPGDPFTMRMTRIVKREGKTLLNKGSLISGSIEEIASSDVETRVTLVLEDVRDAETGMPSSIQARIVKVIRVVPRQPDPEIMDAPSNSQPRTSAQQQENGGVVGGVAPAGGTGQTGAPVVSTTRSTKGVSAGAGQSAETAAQNTLRVVIEPAADKTAPPPAGSVLSMTGGNTRIEIGTTFLLKTTADTPLAVKPSKSMN
jgi:hypothetical protein